MVRQGGWEQSCGVGRVPAHSGLKTGVLRSGSPSAWGRLGWPGMGESFSENLPLLLPGDAGSGFSHVWTPPPTPRGQQRSRCPGWVLGGERSRPWH